MVGTFGFVVLIFVVGRGDDEGEKETLEEDEFRSLCISERYTTNLRFGFRI